MGLQPNFVLRLKSDLVAGGQHKHVPRTKAGPARPSTGRLTSSVQERRVVLRGKITKLIGSCCIARLVVLAAEDQENPIIIHIDSPGGSSSEAMGILSTMNGVRCPVLTYCRGQVTGPAAIIAAHGLFGHRAAASAARFSFKFPGSTDPRDASAGLLLSALAESLSKDTGRPMEEILQWFRTGAEFSAPEAVRAGIIDAVSAEPLYPLHRSPT